MKLLILGRGGIPQLKNMWKLRIDDSQLSIRDSSIKLMGYVDDPVSFMSAATVFVAPMLSGSGTRLKIIEAMAAGKAIVTTTLGAEGIEGVDRTHYMIADDSDIFL